MRRRVLFAVAIIVVAGGAGVYGASSVGLIGGTPAAAAETSPPERATATVTRATLESVEELDGTLGFEGSGTVLNQLTGTITYLYLEEGQVLERGDRLIETDGGTRSYVMYGSRPAWRTLEDGAWGYDVKQLQENLQVLGYMDSSLEPDYTFGTHTQAAVKAWQADRNVEQDGVVRLGDIVFLSGPVRVTAIQAQLGARAGAGQAIATYSSTNRLVTVSLDANRQDIVAVGDPVTVELSDGTDTPGSISEIASVATPATTQGGSPQVAVTIRLEDPATSGSQDGAPVTIRIVRDRREDVLTVPVLALLALAEGGYAVEIAADDGSTRLVAVTPGLFSGTRVEVQSASLSENDLVVVPK